MTTNALARLPATGPPAPAGKAAPAKGALSRGATASLPVIPGEDPGAWQEHRAGILSALAPVGALETALAERAALLLWRLQRVARYEQVCLQQAHERAERLAVEFAAGRDAPGPFGPKTLAALREEEDLAGEEHRGVLRFLAALAEPARAAVFGTQETALLFCAVERATPGLHLPDPEEEGRREWPLAEVTALLARETGREAAALLAEVRQDTFGRHLRLIVACADAERATRIGREAALLPNDREAALIARQEEHLQRALASTLRELDAARERRQDPAALLAHLARAVLAAREAR